MSDLKEYYRILNIPSGASKQLIREVYETALREHNSPYGNKSHSIEKLTEARDQLLKMNSVEEENAKQNSEYWTDDEDKPKAECSNQTNLLKRDLFLSFEEIFQGGNKRITVQLVDGGKKVKDERITIKIKPGIQPGTELPSSIDSNGSKTEFVLVVQDKPNQRFTRLNRTDIEYVAYITTEQSKSGCELSIPTLENDPISLMFDDEITEDDTEEFSDRGLPSEDNKKDRGKLVVRFKISDKPQKQQNSRNKNDNIIEIEVQNKKVEKPKVPEKPKSLLETQNKFDQDHSFNGNSSAANKTTDQVADNSTINNQNAKLETKKVFTNSSYSISGKTSENLNKNTNEPEKQPPNNVYLKLTLEEIYRGCVKHQTVTITNTLKNGNKEKEEKQIPVNVKPGSINGTKITVSNFGDTCFGKKPADVIFTVREESHSLFRRKGCDIEYIPKVKITQKEAILGGKLSIPTLDNKPFEWTFNGGITPDSAQRIPKRGFPVLNEKNQFGDMIVKYEVMFDQEMPQDPVIERDIEITMEQILSGCTKKLKINRVLLDSQGNEVDETKVLTLEIKPGTTDGTKFIFPREGDQHPGRIPADIVFIVRDKAHETFTRNGADIEHTMTITKSQLSNGGQLQVPTLANDGPKNVSLDGLQENNAFRRIQNYGLPFHDNPNKRGDLLIKFNIEEDPQDEPIIQNLNLSYEQILFGWVKKMNIKSKIFDKNGSEVLTRENTITVEVEKGTQEGTEIRFEKLGDKYPGIIPADIIFVVKYKDHPIFDRKGYNIYYTAAITVSEAKNGVEFEIPTLEEKPLLLTIKKGVAINDIQRIENHGLPYPGDADKRGDLIVQYNIVENKCKDHSVEHHLPLSLEKIFQGGNKQMKIKRELLNYKGEIINEENVVTINIPPGTKSGKRFTFPRLGDNLHHDRIPADIVFIAREKEHSIFKRNGNDLEYTATITEDQAMLGCTLKIPTIENEERELTIDKVVTKSDSRKIKGRGLPDPKQTKNRGDLIIMFNIIKNLINTEKSDKQDSKFDEKSLNESSKIQEQTSLDNTEDESTSSFKQTNIIPQDDTVEHYVPVTLENILHGCTKRMKIKRKIFNEMTDTFDERDKIVEIEIKPGTAHGTKIICPRAGDKNPNKLSADVEFIVLEENHPIFTRDGADLHYTAKLTQQQYENGIELRIPTLSEESLPMFISKKYDNIQELKQIHAHGLPLFDNIVVRGDIVVSFRIVENVETVNKQLAHAGKTQRNSTDNQEIQYVDYPLCLKKILTGYSEKITMDCKVVTPNGIKYVQKKLILNVNPGTPNGTHIHPLDENEKICKDIEFITTEIPHKLFKRCGANIEYTEKISTNKALSGGRFEIPYLEGGKVYCKLAPVITLQTIKVVEKRGLPYKDNSKLRGNLIVKFDINDDNENNETLFKKFKNTFDFGYQKK